MYRVTLALGGMTVGDTIQNMTLYELRGWQLYEKEFGPLDRSLRFEGAIARALLPFLKKGTRLEELMIWPKKTEDDEPASLENAFAMLSNLARPKKGN